MAIQQRVAVVGAGAGGLSAARHLLEEGHEVIVFERGSHIGGLWVYGNDNGLSVAYDSLHLNSDPKTTVFRDQPFPTDTSPVPSHQEMHRYLETFAQERGITQRVRFNTSIVNIMPIRGQKNYGWTIEIEDGTSEDFDSVVVATGHQGLPAHPEFAKKFEGDYLHSREYREPLPFAGKRVLIVGVGNSGLDISADVAQVSGETHVTARSPVLIMPRMMFGVHSARVLAKINKRFLPWPVQKQIMIAVSRIFHGKMERWGLRTPKTRTHPASSAYFLPHVYYGRIQCHPGVEKVEAKTITFSNGKKIEVDVMIAATGYEIDMSFLPKTISPLTGRRIDVYKRVVHPSWPGLYFVGFFNVTGGANIAMMDVQSEWVASLVSGKSGLPNINEMLNNIESEKQQLTKRFPGSSRYGLEIEPRQYKRAIASELKRKPTAEGT